MQVTASPRHTLARRGSDLVGASLCAMFTIGIVSAHAQSEADAPKTGFYIEVDGGAEYDSVVSLDELDLSSDEGDTALILDATAGFERSLSDTVDLDLSYNYSVLDYQEFDEVDQTSHILSADLSKDLGKADIGLSGFYVSSDLDGDDFLELGRISPYVSGFFAEGWFARGGVVYSDKTNDVNPGRDATAVIGEIDLYHFPPGKPWFINVGYKYRDEDASAQRFDYVGNTYKARYVYRTSLWDKKARFELSYRRLDRDYRSITPSIGRERSDQRDRTSAELKIDLTPRLNVRLYYTYSDWESNLQSVDFHQHLAGLRVAYHWDSDPGR